MGDIDFSRGGYRGDSIEEHFKWFTTQHMEYWWHFREVLRPADRKYHRRQNQPKLLPKWWRKKGLTSLNRRLPLCYRTGWRKKGVGKLANEDYEELIALSLLNYAVYTGIAEALSFFTEMQQAVLQHDGFRSKRNWKSLYSSLYTSFNAFIQVVSVVIGKKRHYSSVVKENGKKYGWTLKKLKDRMDKDGSPSKALGATIEVLDRCNTRLQIRHQLDHWWTIWTKLDYRFLMDPEFRNTGFVQLDPEANQWENGVDIVQKSIDDIVSCMRDFNLIYKEMAVEGGYLDQYLDSQGWFIDYSNYHPHNGRPKP